MTDLQVKPVEMDGLDFKAIPGVGVRVVDAEEGIVEALVAVTGIKDDVDDVIEPGAFADTLKKRLPRICLNHSWADPIGRTLEARELMPGDPKLPAAIKALGGGALWVKMQINRATQRGKDAWADIKFFGDEQAWSIGYRVEPGKSWFNQKTGARHIKGLAVYEASTVLWGAAPLATTMSIKSLYDALSDEAKHGDPSRRGYRLLHPQTPNARAKHEAIWGSPGALATPDRQSVSVRVDSQLGEWTQNPDGTKTRILPSGTPVTIHPPKIEHYESLKAEIAARGGLGKWIGDDLRQLGKAIVYALTRGIAPIMGGDNLDWGTKGSDHDHGATRVGFEHDPSELEVRLIDAAVWELERQANGGEEVAFDTVLARVLSELDAAFDEVKSAEDDLEAKHGDKADPDYPHKTGKGPKYTPPKPKPAPPRSHDELSDDERAAIAERAAEMVAQAKKRVSADPDRRTEGSFAGMLLDAGMTPDEVVERVNTFTERLREEMIWLIGEDNLNAFEESSVNAAMERARNKVKSLEPEDEEIKQAMAEAIVEMWEIETKHGNPGDPGYRALHPNSKVPDRPGKPTGVLARDLAARGKKPAAAKKPAGKPAGKPTTSSTPSSGTKPHRGEVVGDSKVPGNPGKVYRTADVEDAVEHLARDENVELEHVSQVSTLLDRLAAIANDAKARRKARVAELTATGMGEEEAWAKADAEGKEPVYNLCRVTVAGTNLFCVENQGIPRVRMPQLKADNPIPGSKADKLPRDSRNEVSIEAQFKDYLKEQGHTITPGTMKASHMKATQSELNGAKVAGIAHALDTGVVMEGALMTSNDDYIVDGHHRWAATVGNDAEDGNLGDAEMEVDVVDMSIIELIMVSREFAKEWGIPEAEVGRNEAADADARKTEAKSVPKPCCAACADTPFSAEGAIVTKADEVDYTPEELAELKAMVLELDPDDLEILCGRAEAKGYVPIGCLYCGVDRGQECAPNCEAPVDETKGKGGTSTAADKHKARHLIRWYEHGEGAAKIRWGTDGDFMRCVRLASKHMTPENAKGFCNLRHQGALGAPPGKGHKTAEDDTEAKHGDKGEPGYELLHPPTKRDWDQARAARGRKLTPEQIEGLVNLYDEDGNFVGRKPTAAPKRTSEPAPKRFRDPGTGRRYRVSRDASGDWDYEWEEEGEEKPQTDRNPAGGLANVLPGENWQPYTLELQGDSTTTPSVVTPEAGKTRSLSSIAAEIRRDWKQPNFAAKPYLSAMASLDSADDMYGYDSARQIIAYFLGNARGWKGENAKRIKAELNAMLKAKRGTGGKSVEAEIELEFKDFEFKGTEPDADHLVLEIKTTTPGWRLSVKDYEGNIHHLAHNSTANGKPLSEIQEVPEITAEELEGKRHFSAEERESLAKRGYALPDESFPIENTEDLRNAIKLVGKAKDPSAARRHIIKRAKALGAEDMLPDSWDSAKSLDGFMVSDAIIEFKDGNPEKDEAVTDSPGSVGQPYLGGDGYDGDDEDANATKVSEQEREGKALNSSDKPAYGEEPNDPDQKDVSLWLRVATPGVKVMVHDNSGGVHELPIGAISGDDVGDASEAKTMSMEQLQAKVASILEADRSEDPWELKVATTLLSDTLEAKAGRVMSAANAAKIKDALQKLVEVLTAAGAMDPQSINAGFPTKSQVSAGVESKGAEVAALSEADLMAMEMLAAELIHPS